MTTVFGIRHPKVEAAVLVADRQTTTLDQTGFPTGKYLGRKLWISKDGLYCLGHGGLRDAETEEFVQGLVEGKFDIQKMLKTGYFPELRRLNLKRIGKRLPDDKKISSFMLATRFDNKPRLHTCYPLGSVEERAWTTFGSGSVKIEEYMQALNVIGETRSYLGEHNTQLPDVIRVGLEGVRRAQGQDIYSHGLDLLVCTPEGIKDHCLDLGDDFRDKLKKIQDSYPQTK